MNLQDELARAIARTSGGRGAGPIAAHLLRNEGRARLLVGVDVDGHVIRWDHGMWSLEQLDLPDSGDSKDIHSEVLDKIRTHELLEEWLRENGDDFEWFHPRYRWLRSKKPPGT